MPSSGNASSSGPDSGSLSTASAVSKAPFATPTEAETVTEAPTASPTPVEKEDILDYMKFDLQTYLKPFWSGSVVYNETLMFIRDADGNVAPAPLLYEPTEILSVRSSDLSKEYKPGVDYTVEDGHIVLTPGTSIFRWAYTTYYPTVYKQGQMFACSKGGYLLYAEGTTFTRTQVAVTYRHAGEWTGKIPEYQGSRIPKTIAKLKNKEPLKIVFYGDSITVGCNASGWSGSLAEPKMPIWPDLVVRELRQHYGDDAVTSVNTAVGGTTSAWGLENAESLVAAKAPDLVVLAFGMNDGSLISSAFKRNILGIMEKTRAANPDAEFILVSTSLPNREAAGFYLGQWQYESALNEIVSEDDGAALAPVTSMHAYLLTRKRFYDMTGNNINHPNDFLARMYAQTISRIMIEDYYS